MTDRVVIFVKRTFNKGPCERMQAKLGKNQRPEEQRLGTLFFWTQRNKAFPLQSGNSVTLSQGSGLAGYDGTKAAVSAQRAS